MNYNYKDFELNFKLTEAPQNIQDDILNKGYFYDLKNGEYIRNIEKEEKIKQINHISNLQEQINDLKQINQEQQNIINTYIVKLVQNSNEFTNAEKESLWLMVDNFDNATMKEIELNNILYPEELVASDYQVDSDYQVGNIFWFEDKLYKVTQNHKSQSNWLPDQVPALYAVIATRETAGQIKEWIQPQAHNPYNIGDKVLFNGKTYESIINNNVWSPSAYPAGWKGLYE